MELRDGDDHGQRGRISLEAALSRIRSGAPSAGTDELLEPVVCLGFGPQRNWVSLWKPSIGALSGSLGLAGVRAWCPRNDRIGASLFTEPSTPGLGWSIRVPVSWRASLEGATRTRGYPGVIPQCR
mgnify:CR=1 FL=1